MVCTPTIFPNGARGFICGARPPARRCSCGARARLECDWKVPSRKSGTCDAPICEACTTSPAPGKDLCKAHAAEFEARKAAR